MFEEKRVGKRKSNDEFILPNSKITSEADEWLNTVRKLRCTKKVCRKGLYKFKTFEEADQWMETMIVHNSQESLR
jgi:hypothetical protein